MGKCKTKCCPCCIKGEDDDATEMEDAEEKKSTLSKLNCCKKKEPEDEMREVERAAGKVSIETCFYYYYLFIKTTEFHFMLVIPIRRYVETYTRS